jgi:glycosyltransferase involved in cell wall biosynthesis
VRTLQLVGDSKYGGATYLILEWCKYLIAHSCHVDVLSTDTLTVELLHKIPKVKVIDDIYIPREINAHADALAFLKLIELFAREKYDVVHTYTATPGMLGRIAARLSGTPAIFHHQAAWTVNETSSFFERLFYTPLEFLATMASTRGICVSNAVAKHAEDFCLAPRRKLVTIPNGIDPTRFLCAADMDMLRRELNLDSNTLIIGTTARLAPDKDFPTLLRAVILLLNQLTDKPFVVLIIGDGPSRSEIEALAREIGVDDLIRFLGFRNNIPQLLCGVDIFVTTSLREGLSISLLEAMAAARPIIATSIPPNTELIGHEKTGLLVDARSPEQVASAIIRFVREPELALRCGSSAQELVLHEYTLSRMFEQTWNLYNEFSVNNYE